MKAIGYIRVSTQEQSRDGVSLDAQQAHIQQWVERQNAGLVDVFADEGVSGGASIDKRPGLLAALEAVRKDTVLVVVKRDRLARDAFLSAWLEKEVQRRRGRIVSLAGEGTDSDAPTDVLNAFLNSSRTSSHRIAWKLYRCQSRSSRGVLFSGLPRGCDHGQGNHQHKKSPSHRTSLTLLPLLFSWPLSAASFFDIARAFC